jgi:hypothetical protein
MLQIKDTQIEQNEIYGLKLTSGDDVIGKVVSVTDTQLVVSEPLGLVMVPQANGQPAAQFAPMLMMLDENSDPVFDRKNVVAFYKPAAQFRDAYERAVSNILIPDQSIQT